MSVHEIEAAIIRLTPQQLFGLITWLQDYYADAEDELLADGGEAEVGDEEMTQVEQPYTVMYGT